MRNPGFDTSNIQIYIQHLLSGVLAQKQSFNYLNQEFGDVFVFLWQLYLAQEYNEVETQYTSKNFDPDIGLYYYNARWYDPELGRFITEDPARANSNWYIYASNNPIMRIDPSGLDDTKINLGHGYEYDLATGVTSNDENFVEASVGSTSIGSVPNEGGTWMESGTDPESNLPIYTKRQSLRDNIYAQRASEIKVVDENPGMQDYIRISQPIGVPESLNNALSGSPIRISANRVWASPISQDHGIPDILAGTWKIELGIDIAFNRIPGLNKLANLSVGLRVTAAEFNPSEIFEGFANSNDLFDGLSNFLGSLDVLDTKLAVTGEFLGVKLNYRKELYDSDDLYGGDIVNNIISNILQFGNEGEFGVSGEFLGQKTEYRMVW